MLEGLVAWVINTYVGEYFEDLNTDQLSVGLLQGAVELENLPLKKDAFNFSGYPIEIRSGYVGRIKLQIPVYRLYSEPWVIFIEKLFIVIGPVSKISYDEEKESQHRSQKRSACLQDHETNWMVANAGKKETNSYGVYSNWKSYSTSLLANVLENIQLNVRDVHIRYEDDSSCKNKQLACGLIVRGLTAQSTDKNWVPHFVKGDSIDMTWKLAQMEGLSFYWDTNAVMMGHLDRQQLMESMARHMDANFGSEKEYILSSVDATARFKRNCSSEALKSPLHPRIVCDIQLEKIPLYFSQNQYLDILQWEKSFSCLCIKWSNRKWRPLLPVSTSPREWWLYAVTASVEPLKQKTCTTKESISRRAKELKEYSDIYAEYLKNSEALSSEAAARKGTLEIELDLEVLVILREIVLEKSLRKKTGIGTDKQEAEGGLLQWLFPSWVGWYSSKATNDTKSINDQAPSDGQETMLEEELLTVFKTVADNTYLKRDVVFIQVNFNLSRGTFVLLQNTRGKDLPSRERDAKLPVAGKPVIELEFSDVFVKLETRPRMRSVLFEVKLGSLYLHDRMFATSKFPFLVAAQNQDTYFTSMQSASGLFSFSPEKIEEDKHENANRWLFELVYEKHPQMIQSDYSVFIRTKPLDVVCNLDLIRIVVGIFATPELDAVVDHESFPSVASVRYEHFKEHTKAELQQTWDRMLVGARKSKKNWCIKLEIAAPQILIPEDIFDASTNVLIFVLGDLNVFNTLKSPELHASVSSITFEEDDYYTPCSTPEECVESPMEVAEPRKSSELLYNELYESYTLQLQNMQVLVSSLKDSWKFALLRGSSSLHILDRFSINIQFYRRTFLTEDPDWPSLVFIASLPKLTAHVSELKVGAVKACVEDLEAYFHRSSDRSDLTTQQFSSSIADNEQISGSSEVLDASATRMNKTFFLLMQFSVDEMSLDIQSQSQNVAELQVCGVKVRLSNHQTQTSVKLTVHSFLVVDALQLYGPDFELLVASHKHVCMDNSSGKLLSTDSLDMSDVVTAPTGSSSSVSLDENVLPWAEGPLDDEALIFIEFSITNVNSTEELRSINAKFNNLDIIANQETIIELMGLLKRIRIGTMGKSQSNLQSEVKSRSRSQVEMFLKKETSRTEISFNFHLLNVLLLRAMKCGTVGHKLATATIRDAQIKAAIGCSTDICGTLGGVQILDLVSEGVKYRTIVSLGKESILPRHYDSVEMYNGVQLSEMNDNREALTFNIIKRDVESDDMTEDDPSTELDVYLRMASLYYVHSPRFLFELSCCAVEFKSYLKSLASSIRSAAAEMAKGIVGKNADWDFYQNSHRSQQDLSAEDDMQLNFSCDIFINSPVIVLRHSSTSPEVFLAHLGHVALHNRPKAGDRSGNSNSSSAVLSPLLAIEDALYTEVRGMSLFYINMDSDLSCFSNLEDSATTKTDIIWSLDECLRCPILHDTAIDIIVQPFQDTITSFFGVKSQKSSVATDARKIQSDMRVISPLNVDFTKRHYEQMLKLLESLCYDQVSSEDVSLGNLSNEIASPSSHVTNITESHLLASPLDDQLRCAQDCDSPVLICCVFVLPSLKLELKEYMNEGNSLISLTFQEFCLKYEQKSRNESSILATLSSLLMEDLQDPSDSSGRSVLISSKHKAEVTPSSNVHPFEPISYSCPDLRRSGPEVVYTGYSPSLPDILCTENLFSQHSDARHRIKRIASHRSKKVSSYPNTPPPSPTNLLRSDNYELVSENALVCLHVLLLNEKVDDRPGFRKSSYINIDFNGLDVVFSLHPWNVIFDFFTASSCLNTSDMESAQKFMTKPGDDHVLSADSDSVRGNTDLKISVKSLTVILKKPEYDLVSANVSNFHSRLLRKNRSFHLDGNLGSVSVIDLTPAGRLYRERLVTTGSEPLQFSIASGDRESSKNSVLHIKGNLSSIMYVHTQRLVTEIIVFFQYFYDKRNSMSYKGTLNLSRAANADSHDTHVLLNLSAICPIIILPASALSSDLLIIAPQSITVTNVIIRKGSNDPTVKSQQEKTLLCLTEQKTSLYEIIDSTSEVIGSTSCYDVISIIFGEVSVYSGSRQGLPQNGDDSPLIQFNFPSFTVIPEVNLLQEVFAFDLQVRHSICKVLVDEASSISLTGHLSSVSVTLDIDQYKLVRSILGYNFGEALEECIYDPCKEVGQFVLLNTNEEISTTLLFDIKLSNVTLQLVANQHPPTSLECEMLAKFDFIESQLTYSVFSNNRKDIDFFSNEIRISDIRYKDCPANKQPNVFTNILLPNKERGVSSLQAELHYRLSNDLTKISILLNNMRVTGIMDFINDTLDFLRCPLSPPSGTTEPGNVSDSKENDHSMEMKLNVTNTEFVVVEDASVLDSNAVIAKTTAVIVWKPNDSEKPLSFNLEQFEMFSCILGIEDETALSIIDPLNICLDLVNRHSSPIAKLQEQEDLRTLEVSAMSLYMRFSYYDLVMFIKMLESVKRQFGTQSSTNAASTPLDPEKVLCDLGFSLHDCQRALKLCNGSLDDAALWLTQNANATVKEIVGDVDMQACTASASSGDSDTKSWVLFSIELRMDSIGLCIINDCRDADIPVLDFHLADVSITQKLQGNQEGFGMFSFSLDYYNCSLSGWEPLVEPWRCQIKWNTFESFEESSKKLFLNVTTEDVVNINMTSAFFQLFKMVKDNWTEDYFHRSVSNDAYSGFNKSRSQLMPFKLINQTGCKLWFSTRVLTSRGSLNAKEDYCGSTMSFDEASWIPVENFGTCLFTFGKRVKLRHQDSHQETLHQICVRVEGWQTCVPVSLDRVGTYFRNITQTDSYSRSNDRIVFKVKLENDAQKSVSIESSLSITNKLADVLEVKLERSGLLYGSKEECLLVMSGETLPIPLPHVQSQMWIRPMDKSVAFCDFPIEWKKVTKPGERAGFVRVCTSTKRAVKPYRTCVCIKQGNYPVDHDAIHCQDTANFSFIEMSTVPGHMILVLPCLEIHNMLPCELNFILPNTNFAGILKPGKKQSLCDIDISKSFTLKVSIENFQTSNSINIFSSSRQYSSNLVLRDVQNRTLLLQLHVVLISSVAMQLVISAHYFLVNKTGLPLIFKQDGTQAEAAGQFEEHEMARSVIPFLFSFYDEDASAMCSVRIGKGLHKNGRSAWCPRFRLEKGVQVRQLHVSQNDNRPDWVYNIGIEVTAGKGKYKDSSIVTLSPRYQLDNRSRHVLEFCQKFAIKDGRNLVLSAMPECSFPFHWPRIDLDNLLCVRMANVEGCHWSGGFSIDCIKSFFVNMRDLDGIPHFLQTEIVLHGATYYIIFTDAERFPPPIRIDNHSEVSVTYYQTNVLEERLKTTIRPHSSVPYALDEPMLPPYITCSAPGGSVATYNMNIFREGNQLFYENFIYIAFTVTLSSDFNDSGMGEISSEFTKSFINQELVLDVPTGTRVCLGRKETGKRSQLWRMNSSGMLQHEGSSPPCDMNKPNSSNCLSQKLVLDIAGLGPQPREFVPLMLRKPDTRRYHTQTWRFTSDGRLCCGYPNMYVQAMNGSLCLKRGTFAVLGPMPHYTSILTPWGIPVEQAICRQKLRGGCGVLSVKVVPDGPTRVLKISDLKEKASPVQLPEPMSEIPSIVPDRKENGKSSALEFQLNLKLPKGLGVSVINHLNEDLIYMMMHDIMVEICKVSPSLTVDGSFKYVQIDSQVGETERPIFLYVTPCSKSDTQRHMPAMHFTLHFIETALLNAKIFKHLIVTVKNLTVQLEEFLLLKLLQLFGLNQSPEDSDVVSKTSNELQSSLFRHVTKDPRYYFSTLKLVLQQVRLSVHTTDQLPLDLRIMKRKLGLRLISFEDAAINLDPFLKVHPFETSHFLMDSIIDHYKQELKSQAGKIFGAVDFLGNPLGLMNDVSDGLSGLINEGNVGGLIKNVAHGLSDTAAKLSESLSDGLGSVAIDERHQTIRRQIRQGFSGSSSSGNDHLLAGIRGFGFGLLGGFTSIFTETYEGATQEGIQGLLSGLGKGLVGTVAKPTVGFLDLASGAASAVRDTSKRSSRLIQPHRRPPRKVVGHGYLLPRYSLQQALDQELLNRLNEKNYSELFIAKQIICSKEEDIQVLVSSEKVYFLNVTPSSVNNILFAVPLGNLFKCRYIQTSASAISRPRHYIQLHMKDESLSGVKVSSSRSSKGFSLIESNEFSCKKPQVGCDSGEVAEKAVTQINYAKSLYEEKKFTLEDEDEEDLDVQFPR